MCLLLPCVMGFFVRLITYMLSIFMVIAQWFFCVISSIKFAIHVVWHAHKEVLMYSTSHDDNATTGSFLELQATSAPPNMNMYSTVDFPSSTSSLYHIYFLLMTFLFLWRFLTPMKGSFLMSWIVFQCFMDLKWIFQTKKMFFYASTKRSKMNLIVSNIGIKQTLTCLQCKDFEF